MLHEFLTAHRPELLARCASRVAQRRTPKPSDAELEHGMPLFLDQLTGMLRAGEDTPEATQDGQGASMPIKRGAGSEMDMSATHHGRELMQRGMTVEQVVHDYGDLCQEITGMALEHGAPIQAGEFRMLNRCLDDAIAAAVTEFAYQRDALVERDGADSLNERLGSLAHELRNLLHKATLALGAIRSGRAGLAGATGVVLDHSLVAMGNLIDRSLAEVRITAGMPARHQLLSVADFIADVKISALLEAEVHECELTIPAVDPTLAVDADRDMLFSAVGNLLQNAFKFTAHRSEVTLSAYAEADRVLIGVRDSGVGLAPGEEERMFLPFTQSGANRSGVGLGLAICRRATEANNGVLRVHSVPGSGCVFTIDLPRHPLPNLP